MGVLWIVWPLDQQMAEYLGMLGVAFPRDASRLPTGFEIKQALAKLADYHVEITERGVGPAFQAFVSKRSPDEWATLIVNKYTGDDAEQRFSFKGHETLILRILKLLTPACGPLALIAGAGGDPIVVSREGDLTGAF